MATNKEPVSPTPHHRLFYDSIDTNYYPIFKKLKEELGIVVSEPSKLDRTVPTNLPLLKQSYSLKHFKTSKTGDNSKVLKRTAVQEFIAAKRDIMLHKIRMIEKRKLMKELKDDADYKENFLNIKIKSLNDDVSLFKQNFEDLKQKLENLMSEVGLLGDERDEKARKWQETRNLVISKEDDIKKISKKICLFKSYRQFVVSIFEQYNQPFDEDNFLKNTQLLTYQRRTSLISPSSMKRQDSSRKINKGLSSEDKNFFITTAARSRKGMIYQTSFNVQIQDEVMRLLALLENQQYQMMSELQNDEADITEIDVAVNR